MLTRLKTLFTGPRAWPVECFGKLPCYQDYISLVTSRGAVRWRDWLLAHYRGDNLPPQGVWRFVFEQQKNSEAVVGLIQASSDGRREFPFSLFVACDRGMGRGLTGLTVIWDELAALHWQLVAAPTIQGVYGCCAGRTVLLGPEQSGTALQEPPPPQGAWPRLLVAAPGGAAVLHLVWQAGMNAAYLDRNWQNILNPAG